MRTLLTAIVAATLVAGCGCPEAHELTVEGEAPPAADLVLAVAQKHCDRPIVGRITWITGRQSGLAGHCSWDGAVCPMNAWVSKAWGPEGSRPEDWTVATDAIQTPEAHEIGHWCLLTDDETKAENWAEVVNAEVRSVLHDPP